MKQLALLIGKSFIFLATLWWLAINIAFFSIGLIKQRPTFPIDWRYYPPNVARDAIIFGIIIALVFSLTHYFRVRKIAQGKEFDLSPSQCRSLELSSPPLVILEHCVVALGKIQARIIDLSLEFKE